MTTQISITTAPRVVTLHDKAIQDAIQGTLADGTTVGPDTPLDCAPTDGAVHLHIMYPADDGMSHELPLDGPLTLRKIAEHLLHAYRDYYTDAFVDMGWDTSTIEQGGINGWVPDGFLHCIGTLFLEKVYIDQDVVTFGIGS